MSPWPVDGKTVTSILNYDLTNLANISMLYNNYYHHPPFLKEFQIHLVDILSFNFSNNPLLTL